MIILALPHGQSIVHDGREVRIGVNNASEDLPTFKSQRCLASPTGAQCVLAERTTARKMDTIRTVLFELVPDAQKQTEPVGLHARRTT